jgi:hypothetical protein
MSKAKFSTNGTTWTTATFTTTVSGNFVNIENANVYWGALTSNGQIWKNFQVTNNLGSFNISSSYPSGISQLSTLNNNFLATAGNEVYSSIDLENWKEISIIWTTVTSNFGTITIRSIDYGNGIWVAGGNTGQIRTSTNGTDWTTQTSNFGNTTIRSTSYGNGLWVAGGDAGQIRTSTNGSTWTTQTSNFGTTIIGRVAYGNGLWVAVGNAGQIRTSTNGSTWTTVTSNLDGLFIGSVAYGNNLWIAAGSSQIRTSTNGSTWTTVTSNFGNTTISFVGYGNGLWVAAGSSGQMRTSTNGSTWTTVTSNFGSTFIAFVSYGNGLWVATGSLGQIRTSTNGSTWTTVTSNFGNTTINIANNSNSRWLIGGYQGRMMISGDLKDAGVSNKFIKSQNEQKQVFLKNNGILFTWNEIFYEKISTGINDNFVNGAIRLNSGVYEYIIQGNNAMYYSTNLTTWTTISKPPASSVNDIIAK